MTTEWDAVVVPLLGIVGWCLFLVAYSVLLRRRHDTEAAECTLSDTEAALTDEQRRAEWLAARVEALERVVRSDAVRIDVLRNDAALWHWWAIDLLQRHEPETLKQLTAALGASSREVIAREAATDQAPKVH